jgi:uncharacterized membrane protein YraQ (UPF0718 family)
MNPIVLASLIFTFGPLGVIIAIPILIFILILIIALISKIASLFKKKPAEEEPKVEGYGVTQNPPFLANYGDFAQCSCRAVR